MTATVQANDKRWYDNKVLLLILFFLLPPLGIFAMAKHKTQAWKKIVYIIPASFITLLGAIGIIGAIFIDSYKMGIEHYDKKNYIRAYESFKLVRPDHENYNDAIAKINELKPIVDSLKQTEADEKLKLQAEKQNKEDEKKRVKEADKTEKDQEKPESNFPPVQQDFVLVIDQLKKEYKDQPNELKKSAVRTKRGELIKNALDSSRFFSDWIAVVKSLKTTADGNAIFVVEIPGTGIKLETTNNEFSDMFDNTLINQQSSLYKIISELNKGDIIRVSGEFLKSPKKDFIYEMSLTEAGSMDKPDFLVRFSKVVKLF